MLNTVAAKTSRSLYFYGLVAVLVSLVLSAVVPLTAKASLPSISRESGTSITIPDTVLIIDGLASPGAFVIFVEGSNVIGSTSADGVGNFTHTFNARAAGLHKIGIIATDGNGRLTDIIYTSINLQGFQTTSMSIFLPTTVSLSAPEMNPDGFLVISGQTISNGRVTLVIDNTAFASVQSDSSGNWSYRLSGNDYSLGRHTISAVVQSAPGQQSYPTALLPFLVIEPVVGINKPLPPAITSPKTGDVFDTSKIEVTGTSQPGMQIEIWNHGQVVGTVFANEKGEWSLPISLTSFGYQLIARACNLGACSDFSSPPVSFMVKQLPSEGMLRLTLEKYLFYGDISERVLVRARITGGKPGYQLEFNWGDGITETLTTDEADTTLVHRYDRPGKFSGTVTAIDAEGSVMVVYFTAHMTSRSPLWFAWYWVVAFILWIHVTGWIYFRRRGMFLSERTLAKTRK